MRDWEPDEPLGHDDFGRVADPVSIEVSRYGEYVLDDDPAPSEVFQALASDVRIHVLVHLLQAEQAESTPCSFSELQEAAGSESSAGFAYHLRQLDGHLVRQDEEGYTLTPAGRRAARAIVSGTFTRNDSPRSAS